MSEPKRAWVRSDPVARPASPTVSGLLEAAATLWGLGVLSVLVVIPSVFLLLPLSPEADAVTLCLPGIGPLQQFRQDLEGEQEEVVYIHESVHAEQCRWLGATQYAKRNGTLSGRLTLEAEAFCAEVEVLSGRGAARDRLVDRTVETLVTSYFEGDPMPRSEIQAAVETFHSEGFHRAEQSEVLVS